MKICKYCGGELIDSAVKCKHCGKWIDIICPYCEGEVSPQATICPHCGEKLNPQKEQIKTEKVQKDSYSRGKKITIIFLCIFFLVSLLFVVIIGFNNYIEHLDEKTTEEFSINYSNNIKTKNIIENFYNFKIQKAYDKYINDYADKIIKDYEISKPCAIYKLNNDPEEFGEITQASPYIAKSKLWSIGKCSADEEKIFEQNKLKKIAEWNGGVSLDCAKSLTNEYDYNTEDNLDENGNNYKYQSLCTMQEKQKIKEASIKRSAKEYGVSYDCANAWENRVYKDNYILFDLSKCSQKELQSIKNEMTKQQSDYNEPRGVYTESGMPPALILKDVPIMCYKYSNNGDNSYCSDKQLKIIQDFFQANPNIKHSFIGYPYNY